MFFLIPIIICLGVAATKAVMDIIDVDEIKKEAEFIVNNAKEKYRKASDDLKKEEERYKSKAGTLVSHYIMGVELLKKTISFLTNRGRKARLDEKELQEVTYFVYDTENNISDLEKKLNISTTDFMVKLNCILGGGATFHFGSMLAFEAIESLGLIELLVEAPILGTIAISATGLLSIPVAWIFGFIIKSQAEEMLVEAKEFEKKVKQEIIKIELEIERIRVETVKLEEKVRIIAEIGQSLLDKLQELETIPQLTGDHINTLVAIARTLKKFIFKE